MTLHIDKLRLRFPASHRLQAESIVHKVIQALTRLQLTRSDAFGALVLPPIQIAPTASAEQVAKAIVGQLAARIEGRS